MHIEHSSFIEIHVVWAASIKPNTEIPDVVL